MDQTEALELIGDPRNLANDLEDFRRTATVFSSKRANLISHYPQSWVAVHEGAVIASAKTLNKLLERTDAANIPRERLMIRYIDQAFRKLILYDA